MFQFLAWDLLVIGTACLLKLFDAYGSSSLPLWPGLKSRLFFDWRGMWLDALYLPALIGHKPYKLCAIWLVLEINHIG